MRQRSGVPAMNSWNGWVWDSSTANTLYYSTKLSGGTLTVTGNNPPARTKREESALEWLDRRVDEMRIAL
jgi:hypothetical protein